MAFQAERARGYYDQAMGKLPAEDRRAQRAGLIMAAIYRTLLEEIERDGFPVLDRAHLPHPAAQVLDRLEDVPRRVAVVGAGYAGMAAAVTLAAEGVRVTVFEAGPVVGGRARRIVSQGTPLDNGQHILIGAYSELFRLMRAVGVPSDALLRLPLELRYAQGFRFRPLWLPAPLGLAGGVLLARGSCRFPSALRRCGSCAR